MKRETLLLLSGRYGDADEVVCFAPGDDGLEIEVPSAVVPREVMAQRASPHPWERAPDEWYARFQGAEWVWSRRQFRESKVFKRESLRVRRYFQLPSEAMDARLSLVACSVGGMEITMDGHRLSDPDWGPQGADNYYAELAIEDCDLAGAGRHVLEMDIRRCQASVPTPGTEPAGLIYAAELAWKRETRADLLGHFVAAWFKLVGSAFFRIAGLLGFLLFLLLALLPTFSGTSRSVFAIIATGFLGAWLSPLVRMEAEKHWRARND